MSHRDHKDHKGLLPARGERIQLFVLSVIVVAKMTERLNRDLD